MILFLVGFVSLLAQVVLLRELNVASYGIELSYLVTLASWLAGTAAGAVLVPSALRASSTGARVLVAATALALPLDVAFVRGSRSMLGGVPGAYLPIERQALVLLAATVPLALAFGLAFRWAARLRAAEGGRLSAAYGVECAGAAAAGILSTLAFRAGVSTFALAVATTTMTMAALAGVVGRGRGGARRRALLPAIVLIAGVGALGQSGRGDRAMTRWTHPSLVETVDTPYARVTVSRNGSQVSVFENDVLSHESETAANEDLPHLAALQHPSPARILLLGGSVELVDRELAAHRPAALVHVEMDRAMVLAARAAMGVTGRDGSLRVADPRAFLRQEEGHGADEGRAYDLIVVALPEPVSGQTNRFYTREFFEACAARLAPGGILGFRLQVPENYLSRAALLKAASVARALGSVFRHVEVLPASTAIVLASQRALPEAETLIQRHGERRLSTRLVTPAYINYLYRNDRRQELRAALSAANVPANRDAQPVTYLYTAVGWLSKFVPALIGGGAAPLPGAARWPAGWQAAPFAALALIFATVRRRPMLRRAALAAAAGFAGMALESVVLLDFQAKSGALFEDLGWLVMAFMAGSTAGALVIAGLPSPSTAVPTRLHRVIGRPDDSALCRPLLLALSALAVLSAWVVARGLQVGLGGATVWLLATGALVAAVFAAASTGLETQGEGAIGRLYAADLLGGCLGSIAASLLLIPLAGLGATAYVAAAVSLLALLAA